MSMSQFELGTEPWFDAVNERLQMRSPARSIEPLLADLAGPEEIESALRRGLSADGRHIAVNVLVDSAPTELALNVQFSRGRFSVAPGWVTHCDAVVRLDLETAREAFRRGTDSALTNAVMEERIAGAGSWDAINFLRVHLVPEGDHHLRAVTS